MGRALIAVGACFLLAGCGARTEKPVHSVAEVKAVFKQHGIRLSPISIPVDAPYTQLVVTADLEVDVYKRIPKTFFFTALGDTIKQHSAIARNVLVLWNNGRRGTAIRAAIDDLR